MNSLKELRIHLVRVDDGGQTSKPDKKLRNARRQRHRRKTASSDTNIKCHVCEELISSNNLSNLARHMDRHHGRAKTTFPCGICKRVFRHPEIAANHRKTHVWGSGPPYVCTYCGKGLTTVWSLSDHVRGHTSERPYHCDLCSETFSTMTRLSSHRERVHVKGRPFSCEVCGKTSKTRGDLRIHLITHSGTKKKCPQCVKTFNVRYLTAHINNVHRAQESGVKCPFCPKKFRPIGLKQHLKTHTNEKPHKCAYCEKQFTTLACKKVHEAIHTGERRFKCKDEACGKRFTHYNSLILHERTHLPERPFKCQICSASYLAKQTLRVHQALKHPETTDERSKVYKCEFCEYTSNYSANSVAKHVQRIHVNGGRRMNISQRPRLAD